MDAIDSDTRLGVDDEDEEEDDDEDEDDNEAEDEDDAEDEDEDDSLAAVTAVGCGHSDAHSAARPEAEPYCV